MDSRRKDNTVTSSDGTGSKGIPRFPHDYDGINVDFNNIVSMLPIIGNIVDATPETLVGPPATEEGEAQDVAESITRDLRLLADNPAMVHLFESFLRCAGGKSTLPRKETMEIKSEIEIADDTCTQVAASVSIVDPLFKLELLANMMCGDMKIMKIVAESMIMQCHPVWTQLAAAVRVTSETLTMLLAIWYRIGSRLDINALAQGKRELTILPSDDSRVAAANMDVKQLMSNLRRGDQFSDAGSESSCADGKSSKPTGAGSRSSYASIQPLPLHERLRDEIVPILKVARDSLM
uniref:Wsv023-like protein n=1 Tax=Melicertus latisulcatus pemonivirus TaxID=2984278 RepID=A0A9C7F0D1_9VIRU|nr:MAG: wsv023-like protein [Melicertus latisulcatus pemonivirus]